MANHSPPEPDRRKRDAALESLRAHLQRNSPSSPSSSSSSAGNVDDDDRTHNASTAPDNDDDLALLKLWKGLFFALWMSDGARVQQALARDLAALPLLLPQPARARRFVRAFWRTMAREWGGIDGLRCVRSPFSLK
jgi:ribosomal RNA-processing protein 1